MTTTMQRTSQALAEWTRLFPLQVTETYTASVTFIKQLTTVAVSTITYLKNAFPEDNYTIDQFGGLKIRVLKNKCEDELAQFLITALTQAYEAFDKKYLHQLALCFYSDPGAGDSQPSLLEAHVFEYQYSDEGAALRVRSLGAAGGAGGELGAVSDRTLQLIRACMVMLSNSPLPDTYDVSVRLYYNDAAPAEYQAPGFAHAYGDDPVTSAGSCGVKLGSVRTPYHELTLRTYGGPWDDSEQDFPDSREAIASQNPPEITQALATQAGLTGEAGAVRCSCRLRDDDPATTLITCRCCGTRQHAACYGLLWAGTAAATAATAAATAAVHVCVVCAGAGRGRCPDTALLRAGNQACYALFRRALVHAAAAGRTLRGRSLCTRLQLPTAAAACKLLAVMRAFRVLARDPPADLDTPVEIDTERLESVMKKYFRTDEEDILDRLVEESVTSQETPDPVGEVLGPMETVSLRNATEIGRVIPAEVNNNRPVDDETLKHYRDAMDMTDTSEQDLPNTRITRKRQLDKPAKTGVKSKRVKTTRK